MQQVISPLSLSLSLAVSLVGACATSTPDTGTTQIEIRSGIGVVTGTAFRCTGEWPSSLTPCNFPWSSKPVTSPSGDANGLVDLSFTRSPIPVDGGATVVVLALQFGVEGQLGASARASTTGFDVMGPTMTADARSGWVDPVITGRSADQRNAGAFSLTFDWGTISGTYDTALTP